MIANRDTETCGQDLLLAVVGQANALGSFPEVPLIIRSLADAMFFDGVSNFILSPEVIGIERTKTDVWDPVFSSRDYQSDWWTSPGSDMNCLRKQDVINATRVHQNKVNIFPCVLARFHKILM